MNLEKGEKYEWSRLARDTKFIPIIMIVIYFGTDKIWDGAKCLYDMLDIDTTLKPFVTNYKLNLFDYHEYNEFSFFKTENRLVFETLACSHNKRKMRKIFEEKRNEYKNLDITTLMLICDLIGLKNSIKEKIEEGEEMCRAVEDLINDAIEEGMEKGMEKGMEEALSFAIKNLIESLKVSAVQAMKLLKIPETEYEKYVTMLE